VTATADALLDCWFGGDLDSPEAVARRNLLWFRGDAAFDALLRERFAELPPRAQRGELDAWLGSPRSRLALVLALDQLPRNLFRGTARCFAFDAMAREVADAAIARGDDRTLAPIEAIFLYLPFEHAEDLDAQERSVALFEALAERAPDALRPQLEASLTYAEQHREVVRRFGRFPHRNDCLGRASTDAEREYLAAGGETWGRGGDE
jgi:uncharacterized protein (DUF924 family)